MAFCLVSEVGAVEAVESLTVCVSHDTTVLSELTGQESVPVLPLNNASLVLDDTDCKTKM